jgi:hypothetical protein
MSRITGEALHPATFALPLLLPVDLHMRQKAAQALSVLESMDDLPEQPCSIVGANWEDKFLNGPERRLKKILTLVF